MLIIQNWTFFSSTAWLPKRPILGRNRNLKGSPCLLSIYSLGFGICYGIDQKNQLIWVLVLVSDLKQNSGFGLTLEANPYLFKAYKEGL